MKKILIVDDEIDIRTFLKVFLEDNGFDVQCAENGIDGLEKFETFIPDLAIIDIIMPERSGVVLYNQIRKNQKYENIPVIILSSMVKHQSYFNEHMDMKKPPDAFVDKPFDQTKLLKIINSLV